MFFQRDLARLFRSEKLELPVRFSGFLRMPFSADVRDGGRFF
jgi:hypothetical protein